MVNWLITACGTGWLASLLRFKCGEERADAFSYYEPDPVSNNHVLQSLIEISGLFVLQSLYL